MKTIEIELNEMEHRAFCRAYRIFNNTKAHPNPIAQEFFAKKAVQRMILEQFAEEKNDRIDGTV